MAPLQPTAHAFTELQLQLYECEKTKSALETTVESLQECCHELQQEVRQKSLSIEALRESVETLESLYQEKVIKCERLELKLSSLTFDPSPLIEVEQDDSLLSPPEHSPRFRKKKRGKNNHNNTTSANNQQRKKDKKNSKTKKKKHDNSSNEKKEKHSKDGKQKDKDSKKKKKKRRESNSNSNIEKEKRSDSTESTDNEQILETTQVKVSSLLDLDNEEDENYENYENDKEEKEQCTNQEKIRPDMIKDDDDDDDDLDNEKDDEYDNDEEEDEYDDEEEEDASVSSASSKSMSDLPGDEAAIAEQLSEGPLRLAFFNVLLQRDQTNLRNLQLQRRLSRTEKQVEELSEQLNKSTTFVSYHHKNSSNNNESIVPKMTDPLDSIRNSLGNTGSKPLKWLMKGQKITHCQRLRPWSPREKSDVKTKSPPLPLEKKGGETVTFYPIRVADRQAYIPEQSDSSNTIRRVEI